MSYEKREWRSPLFFILGPDPFSRRADGCLLHRIQTFYPDDNIIISEGACHAEQRLNYYDFLDQERASEQLERLSIDEREALTQRSIALIVSEDENSDVPIVYFRIEGNDDLVQEGMKLLAKILPTTRLAIL